MATTMTEITHGPTYSMEKEIGAMAWQQKFHLLIQFYYFYCRLTHSLLVGVKKSG